MSNSKTAEDTIDARPVGHGKDPLAEGMRLHNPSNSSDANSYEVSSNEVTAPKAHVVADGQVSAPVKPAHKTPNKSKEEQEEVAAGRVEPGEETSDVTPELGDNADLPDEETPESPAPASEEPSEPEDSTVPEVPTPAAEVEDPSAPMFDGPKVPDVDEEVPTPPVDEEPQATDTESAPEEGKPSDEEAPDEL